MYRTIIEFKHDISGEKLEELKELTDKAFINRAGSMFNKSDGKYTMIFEGDSEKDWSCIGLAVINLARELLEKGIKYIKYVDKWENEYDDEPEENHSVKDTYIKIYKRKGIDYE